MPIRESDVYIKGYNDALQYFNNKQNLNNNARDAFCQAYGEIYYLSSKHPQTWRYMHNSASDMRLKNWIIAREYYKTHYNNEPLQPEDLKEVLDDLYKIITDDNTPYELDPNYRFQNNNVKSRVVQYLRYDNIPSPIKEIISM